MADSIGVPAKSSPRVLASACTAPRMYEYLRAARDVSNLLLSACLGTHPTVSLHRPTVKHRPAECTPLPDERYQFVAREVPTVCCGQPTWQILVMGWLCAIRWLQVDDLRFYSLVAASLERIQLHCWDHATPLVTREALGRVSAEEWSTS